jgi:hypothetical protein
MVKPQADKTRFLLPDKVGAFDRSIKIHFVAHMGIEFLSWMDDGDVFVRLSKTNIIYFLECGLV